MRASAARPRRRAASSPSAPAQERLSLYALHTLNLLSGFALQNCREAALTLLPEPGGLSFQLTADQGGVLTAHHLQVWHPTALLQGHLHLTGEASSAMRLALSTYTSARYALSRPLHRLSLSDPTLQCFAAELRLHLAAGRTHFDLDFGRVRAFGEDDAVQDVFGARHRRERVNPQSPLLVRFSRRVAASGLTCCSWRAYEEGPAHESAPLRPPLRMGDVSFMRLMGEQVSAVCPPFSSLNDPRLSDAGYERLTERLITSSVPTLKWLKQAVETDMTAPRFPGEQVMVVRLPAQNSA